jgi:AcrR family transcriptional regulator
MAKSGTRGRRRATRGEPTKRRIVDAAIQTLKDEGFAGASARAIAATGGFNQGLIFYHFGSVNELLVAALQETSSRRMVHYTAALDGVRTLDELIHVATEIYREDLASGHIKVLAELIAGSSSVPELGPRIVELVEPWIRFAKDSVRRVTVGSPLEHLAPAADVAYGIVALYLGIELLSHLDPARSRADSLFATGLGLGSLLAAILGGLGKEG